MERHKCKLRLKSFCNGSALGGHLRSHLLNFSIPPNLKDEHEIESASSYDKEQDEDGEEKEILYGLRENPKPSSKFVDPEVLQDRESETESSKNTTRIRSKRTRKMPHKFQDMKKKVELNSFSRIAESWEQPASSVSDTTTEEDVAFCLMMLSRDNKWKKTNEKEVKIYEEYQETDESEDEMKTRRGKGKYKCETCKKVFNSYQALGGHRASHKKLKLYNPKQTENAVTSSSSVAGKKMHECPYCFRVFASGQALGGHKRSHVTGSASHTVQISKRFEQSSNFIDLNLPAPIDEDDASQIEVSAVSDAEFVDHIKEVSHSKNKL